MAQAIETPQKTPQGGGRGLLMVWRKELEKKLSINRYLPGKSRGVHFSYHGSNGPMPRKETRS